MSPLCPPPGFPPHLAVIWPLIWAQILVLRAMVRAAYGKGTPYRWSVTPWGRAFIVSVDWVPGQKLAALKPPAHSNDRIAAALDGRAFTPDYIRVQPPLPRACKGQQTHCVCPSKGLGIRGKGIAACAVLAETARPLTLASLPRERGLPSPET